MAKKKVTHQDKPTQDQDQTQQNSAMDDASEKLESLKSLNSMLLKETVERRQQVDSLIQSKGSLESELTRSQMEKEALQTELTRLQERSVQVELERNLVREFVTVQVKQQEEVMERERDGFAREKAETEKILGDFEREMREVVREKREIEKVKSEKESEIGDLEKKLNELVVEIGNEREVSSRASRDKDAVMAELNLQIKEAIGLKLKLVESEKREMKIQKEIVKLRTAYSKVMEEKEDRDGRIVSMLKDKDSTERSLVEANRLIDELKREIDRIVREKEGIEEVRNVESKKRIELENDVSSLNETVLSLRNDEEKLRLRIAEMEKICVESEGKEKQMVMEIDALRKENDEKEKMFESLIEEKNFVAGELDELSKQFDEQSLLFDKIDSEKVGIEEAKVKLEYEKGEVEKEMARLRTTTLSLEETIKGQKEKIRQLEFKIIENKDSMDRVIVERDEAIKGLDGEKRSGLNLKAKLIELEKKIIETQGELEKIKVENFDLLGEKKGLESRFSALKEEKILLAKSLLETQKGSEDKQAKVEYLDANLKLALKMVKNTVGFVNVSRDITMGVVDENGLADEEKIGDEMKPYVLELEAIEIAFRNRETKLAEMSKEVEFLKNSIAETNKKKSFWTLVSSATTLFAAASVAYVARGR